MLKNKKLLGVISVLLVASVIVGKFTGFSGPFNVIFSLIFSAGTLLFTMFLLERPFPPFYRPPIAAVALTAAAIVIVTWFFTLWDFAWMPIWAIWIEGIIVILIFFRNISVLPKKKKL